MGVLPDLGHGVGRGVDPADHLVPFPPECGGHHPRHVQPPTVHPARNISVRLHPPAGHGEKIILHRGREIETLRGADLGEFRQLLDPLPALPAELVFRRVRIVPRVHHEPILVRRGLLVFPQVLEGEKSQPGVVENAVEDDPHAAPVRLGNQIEEKLVGGRPLPCGRILRLGRDDFQVALRIRTEPRVDMVETERVIFVVRTGPEDGIQINGVDPEVAQVIELVDDALDVAAIAPFPGRSVKIRSPRLLPSVARIPVRGPGAHPPGLRCPFFSAEAVAHRVVGRIAIAEALGKNLIPDRFGLPRLRVGRRCPGARPARPREEQKPGAPRAFQARPPSFRRVFASAAVNGITLRRD